MPDDVFLKEIRAGQKLALHELYTKYRLKFIRVLTKNYTCNIEQATEIYQIAIVLVYENIISGKLTKLNNEHSLWNYIYKTGVHKYTDWHRYQRKITEAPEEFLGSIVDDEEAFDDRSKNEELQRYNLGQMQKALAGLGNPCTKVLELFYYEKKSMREITELLNYNNEKTTKTQKYKCLKRLRQAFYEISKNKQ